MWNGFGGSVGAVVGKGADYDTGISSQSEVDTTVVGGIKEDEMPEENGRTVSDDITPAMISDFVAQIMPLVEKTSKGGAPITTDWLIRSGLPPAAAAEVTHEVRRLGLF